MLLQKAPLSYYEDGMITVLLFNVAGKVPRSYKPLNRTELSELLSYPNTSALHIYNITTHNAEEVLALVRFAKSLYNVPIFCYYDKYEVEVPELPYLCEKTIHYRG